MKPSFGTIPRWIGAGILLLAQTWAAGAATKSANRMVVRCVWSDPYDNVAYDAVLDPAMAVIAKPGSRMTVKIDRESRSDSPGIEVLGIQIPSNFTIDGGQTAGRNGAAEVILNMPDTGGSYPIHFQFRAAPDAAADSLSLTILVPKKARIQRNHINGYVVGAYPAHADDRQVPDRFIEVTPEIMDLHVSKLFRVRDFVSNSRTENQRRYFPKYAIIRYSLIIKVERLVEIIDRSPHYECKGIRVLSGYRTPDYNRMLPEAAGNSYHLYGLAADIIVDSAPADGAFDDVNRDGRVNLKDAASLAQICDYLEVNGVISPGGVGLYEYQRTNSNGKKYFTYHVHVDARKTKPARWGFAFKNGRKYARLVWNSPGKK